MTLYIKCFKKGKPMEYIDFKNEANDLIDKITEILKLMDLQQKSQEVKSLEAEMNTPGFGMIRIKPEK